MTQVVHLINAYLTTQNYYLDSKPKIFINSNATIINFVYQGSDVEVCIYNSTFIKLKIDNIPYAICDSIKTFRGEMDKLYTLRYQ